MLSFNPANAQWPFQMLFSSMHCLLHVPISLVTKVLELLNWNWEVFFLQEEQSWANWSCPDRCRLSFQSTATEILFWEKSHQKHLRKCTLVEQQGACTVFEGDSKPPVLTDSRTNTVSTSQIQDLLYPSSPWSRQLPGFRCKLSTFQLLEAVARVVNSGDNSGK